MMKAVVTKTVTTFSRVRPEQTERRSFMMRAKVLPALFSAILISAPGYGQEVMADPASHPDRFATQWLEAWSSGDVDRILMFYTDDVVYEDVPSVDNGWDSRPLHGKQELREALVEGFTAMPDLGFELGSVRTNGKGMVVEWTMTGTHTGDWPGLPATGRSISIRGVTLAEVEGSRVARSRDYYDMLLFLSQLGAIPAITGE
jgi:steroid delta-isomerase-like uncharacterized protein